MSTTDPIAPPNTAPIRFNIPAVNQVVKGNVTIKKLSKYKYRITFSKIGKFLVYQIWDKDNTEDNNSNRFVNYVSAKRWVQYFNIRNKQLKQQNKPLFTPTTVIKMQNQIQNYPVVIHKAYMNTSGHVVFTVSTKEIKLESNNTSSSKKLIKIPCGKFNNVRFDIDAPKNGIGMVYNAYAKFSKVLCPPPLVSSYAFGGGDENLGSSCGDWLTDDDLNIVWKALPDALKNVPKEIRGNPPYNYNWSAYDLFNERYTFE